MAICRVLLLDGIEFEITVDVSEVPIVLTKRTENIMHVWNLGLAYFLMTYVASVGP